MYESTEIRWFNRNKDENILKWFSNQGLSFNEKNIRTDFYLPVNRKDDLGVKLREGNIEIKQRVSLPILLSLSPTTIGYRETWVKWSFNAAADDKLSVAITKDKKYSWDEVIKDRLGVKLIPGENNSIKIVDIKERIPFGCQVEYTRIQFNGVEWFSFGLEWFGETFLKVKQELIIEILGDTNLLPDDSFGYPGFLRVNCK